jgi:hypothetical protein
MNKETYIERYSYVCDNFDFEKVHGVMELLDWKWCTKTGFKVPSVSQMVILCHKLFEDCYKELEQRSYPIETSTGGFTVSVDTEGHVGLKFTLAESFLEHDHEIEYEE